MQFRGGQPYTPKCDGTGAIVGADFRGRSVRCSECLIIAVRPEGDTDLPYVHWTDASGCGEGHTWLEHSFRQPSNGRLIVARPEHGDWRSFGPMAHAQRLCSEHGLPTTNVTGACTVTVLA